MVETQKSIADLLTSLPDNTSGEISPQDVRDVVFSMQVGLGGFSLLTPAATTLPVTIGDWVKLEGVTQLLPANTNWTMPQNNRIQQSGAVTFLGVGFGFVVLSGPNNTQMEIGGYKNGVLLPSSVTPHYLTSTVERDSIVSISVGTADPGDYYELWVRSTTGTGSVTAEAMFFGLLGSVA